MNLRRNIPGKPKKMNKIIVTILVVWQLLSGFCLTHPMLCDCDTIEKDFLLLCTDEPQLATPSSYVHLNLRCIFNLN